MCARHKKYRTSERTNCYCTHTLTHTNTMPPTTTTTTAGGFYVIFSPTVITAISYECVIVRGARILTHTCWAIESGDGRVVSAAGLVCVVLCKNKQLAICTPLPLRCWSIVPRRVFYASCYATTIYGILRLLHTSRLCVRMVWWKTNINSAQIDESILLIRCSVLVEFFLCRPDRVSALMCVCAYMCIYSS